MFVVQSTPVDMINEKDHMVVAMVSGIVLVAAITGLVLSLAGPHASDVLGIQDGPRGMVQPVPLEQIAR